MSVVVALSELPIFCNQQYPSPFSAPQNRQLMNRVGTKKLTRASFQPPLTHVSYNRAIFIIYSEVQREMRQ